MVVILVAFVAILIFDFDFSDVIFVDF